MPSVPSVNGRAACLPWRADCAGSVALITDLHCSAQICSVPMAILPMSWRYRVFLENRHRQWLKARYKSGICWPHVARLAARNAPTGVRQRCWKQPGRRRYGKGNENACQIIDNIRAWRRRLPAAIFSAAAGLPPPSAATYRCKRLASGGMKSARWRAWR
jgi:hypothetical protein